MSERDGWNHLYLYDFDGRLIRRLTRGTFPGVGIEAVDDKGGWVYFTAHGDEARPYDTHLYRVSLEGTEFGQLTDAPGRHEIEFSPSREFFLDTHSSPDRPPRVELRRADGVLLRALSVADISGLEDLGWRPADEFTIKAADGKTDLYGLLWKPYDFDADLKYPVIEYIYGCPQVAVVPRSFTHWEGIYPQALAQLGFVVFVVDARGTPERGKAFQDVAYGNMGRHEIPDHVGALRQLIEQRPYMDGDRVGMFGHSCGGYFTIRALLLAPDAYHVGVASAPVVELEYGNAMEVYMGPPDENRGAYEYASNVRLAGNLEGKLFLIHGTSDFAAPLSGTMKMVEALIQAGEAYDLLLFPEQDHGLYGGSTGTYWQWAVRRYFQEHLKPELGSEPGRTGGR
jgi:dipeptidyl aminopeptidase/acylaminoacyl peptidase